MPLKVMSYNVGAQSEKRLAAIVDVIRKQNPDVVALLDPETQALSDAFAHNLGMRAYYGKGNHGWGIAWLTRLPAQRTENRKLAMFHNLIELVVLWEGRPVHLFATHLRGLGAESQVGVEARLRTEETRAILDILRPLNSEPLLVVGDFNASRPGERAGEPPPGTEWWSHNCHRVPYARQPIQLLLEFGLLDCYRRLHAGSPGYSIRTDHPWSRIDFVFASPEFAPGLRACDIVTSGTARTASHHFPIWAEFR